MRRIAIIGGGFSGTLTAIHLSRNSAKPAVTIFDRSERFARGVAYGTSSEFHLLNVPAARMSAFEDEPGHFLDWWKKRDPKASGTDFAPRRIYGDYLGALLETCQEHISLIPEQVLDVTEEFRVQTDEREYEFDAVVLALGNFPPANPFARWPQVTESPRYHANPWRIDAVPIKSLGDRLLLIGSGLTAVDVVVDAYSRGFTGTFELISRHGLLPASHVLSNESWELSLSGNSDRRLRPLVRWLREEIENANQTDINWRTVFDALRPETQTLWASLSGKERHQFLRHLRAYWDVHRHRLAPELSNLLERLQEQGRLTIRAGRILSGSADDKEITLTIQPRSSENTLKISASTLINCTGPAGQIRHTRDALIENLFRRDLVDTDISGMGLKTTPDGLVMNGLGQTIHGLYAMGPLRKGELWECTAVRELRTEAAKVAAHILSS